MDRWISVEDQEPTGLFLMFADGEYHVAVAISTIVVPPIWALMTTRFFRSPAIGRRLNRRLADGPNKSVARPPAQGCKQGRTGNSARPFDGSRFTATVVPQRPSLVRARSGHPGTGNVLPNFREAPVDLEADLRGARKAQPAWEASSEPTSWT